MYVIRDFKIRISILGLSTFNLQMFSTTFSRLAPILILRNLSEEALSIEKETLLRLSGMRLRSWSVSSIPLVIKEALICLDCAFLSSTGNSAFISGSPSPMKKMCLRWGSCLRMRTNCSGARYCLLVLLTRSRAEHIVHFKLHAHEISRLIP